MAVYVIVGPQGCGKSRWSDAHAAERGFKVVDVIYPGTPVERGASYRVSDLRDVNQISVWKDISRVIGSDIYIESNEPINISRLTRKRIPHSHMSIYRLD